MDNFLDNGAVLPSGLLGGGVQAMMDGFNKSYRNTQLRIGIIIRAYVVSDDENLTKLTTEYDVLVFEQNENRGSSIMTYKHCVAAEGLGSIPDFFEKTLRIKTNATTVGSFVNTKGQNGAIVLIQCLDGMSDKAIIIGAVTHPDRQTTLVDDQPYLQGEYNGVNVTIDNQGSVTLTFKGATDNDGNQVDSSQGNTVATIEQDGSVQIQHSTITLRLDRSGTVTLTAQEDLDLNITGDVNANVTGKAVITADEIDLNGTGGAVLTTETDPVVDTIFGAPTMGVDTVKAGS
jgi:hypothetical protein